MIMLGSVRDDEFGRLQATPATLGGTTQSPYIVVSDANIIYQRAKAAGAEIVVEIKDEDYGGRVSRVAIPRATSGTSAPMIHGRRPLSGALQ